MIATIAFVLGFVTIGLAVVFFAFGGGSARGARENLHSQSRGGRRFAAVAIGVVCAAFGILVPALVLADNHNNQADNAPGGVELTSAQEHGRRVFARNCATCHTLAAANSAGRVGPNLDQLRPPKALVLNAIQVGRARGQGQMPSQLVDGKDAQDVADFIAATAGH